MVTKRNFRDKEEEADDKEKDESVENTAESMEDIDEERRIQTEVDKIVAQSRMIYNRGEMNVDMCNLRASYYKYNRYVHRMHRRKRYILLGKKK